ncbi:MmgE/PrpD family protein [Peribacillus sp. R9-11]|uniref:MmgE/PrpD family protein n=1 Tax=Peribacillus sp. R9-11 TaxID=3073271 RepID=UPI00286841D3|nr:MmgE/PrpD family protein [Peribacillus sp. R9-11]WMX55102.1 MmgE/PrpD family protein [Peribacillus sp. R9-11]
MNTEMLEEAIYYSNPLENELVKNAAIEGMLDYLAVSYQTKSEKEITILKQIILDEGGNGKSYLIGSDIQATRAQAALFNGFQAHLLDYDDVHSDVRGHPSAVILSALLAVGEPEMPGNRFLAAYVIGVEIMARFGEAMNPYHYTKGWHNTATLGVIAAAGAIAYLREYPPRLIAETMSLAATQSAGLRLQFGTVVKPLHVGIAAKNAVDSADWIRAGLHSNPDFLNGKNGFFEVYADNGVPDLTVNWGKTWRIVTPGLWFKQYPFCSAAAHGVEAAVFLQKKYDLSDEDIQSVSVCFPPNGDSALIHRNPATGEEGRFSIEYIVWLALSGKPLTFSSFESTPIPSSWRKSFQKVTREIDVTTKPSKTALPVGRFTIVNVTTTSGDVLSKRTDTPKGSPGNPLTKSQLKEKLLQAVGDDVKTEKIIASVHALTHTELGVFQEATTEAE